MWACKEAAGICKDPLQIHQDPVVICRGGSARAGGDVARIRCRFAGDLQEKRSPWEFGGIRHRAAGSQGAGGRIRGGSARRQRGLCKDAKGRFARMQCGFARIQCRFARKHCKPARKRRGSARTQCRFARLQYLQGCNMDLQE